MRRSRLPPIGPQPLILAPTPVLTLTLALTLVLTLALSACAPPVVEPELTVALPPVPVVEPEPSPEPDPIPDPIPEVMPEPDRLLGLSPADIRDIFGPASLVRREDTAQVIQFAGAACVFDIYFYEAAAGQAFRASYLTARDLSGESVAATDCLKSLLPGGYWPADVDARLGLSPPPPPPATPPVTLPVTLPATPSEAVEVQPESN